MNRASAHIREVGTEETLGQKKKTGHWQKPWISFGSDRGINQTPEGVFP